MEFQVNPNNVILSQIDQIESGEYNITECNFIFSNEYDGLTKIAVFTGANGDTYKITILNNKCEIPNELLAETQIVQIGVYAYDVQGTEMILRYSPIATRFYIHKGSYVVSAVNMSRPTPTEVEQLQSQITHNANDIEELQQTYGQYGTEISQLQNDVSEIKAEQTEQNTNIQKNTDDIVEINQTIETINTDVGDLKQDINSINQNIDDLEQDLTNYSPVTETGSQIELQMNTTDYKLKAILKDKNGTVIHNSNVIDLPLESFVVSASYDNTTKEIVLTLQNGQTLRFSVADLVSGLVSEDSLQTILANYYTKIEVDNLLSAKANQSSLNQTNQNVTDLTGRVSTNEEDIADIKAEQTTQNTNIEALQNQVETLQEDLDNANSEIAELNTDITNMRKAMITVEGQGSDITLQNTSENKFVEFGLEGRTEQKTLTGKNLFNPNAIENENIIVSDEGKTIKLSIANSGSGYTSTNKTLSELCPNLNVGDVVYLYCSRNLGNTYNNYIYLSGINLTWVMNTSKTITQDMLDSTVILYGNNYINGETSQCILTDFRITKIENADWEEYCGGIPAPNPIYKIPIKNVTGNSNVKIQNKNLFDESIFKQYDTKEDDEAYKMYNSQVYNKDLTPNISFKENTSYTLMYEAKQSSGNPRLAINYDDGTIVECPNTAMSINYTQYMLVTPSNKKIKNISFKYGSTGYVYIKKNSVMVLEGAYTSETIPSYVPHKEQNYPFTFAEGQRAMQGTQLLDDGIHNEYKQKIFDGSDDESWNLQGINANGIANFYIGLSDYSGRSQNLALVNYFLPQTTPIAQTIEEGFYLVSTKTLYIRIKSSIASTVAEFRTWLSTHNLLVEYELAEEEIIPYNETQQAQYDAIKEATSYDDITYITSESDELGFDMNVVAVANANKVMESELQEIKSAVIALGGDLNV